MKINVKWEVTDGYVGKERPQTTEIYTEDFMSEEDWNSLLREVKIGFIEQIVKEDFYNKISYEIKDYEI